MKMKLLATAVTVSLPLVFGGAYAQSTATGDSGNNRSSDGGAVTTNPAPPGASSGAQTSATTGQSSGSTTPDTGSTASGASTSNAATTGAADTGTVGSTRTGAPGTGATGTAVPDSIRSATAPGMEAQSSTASTEAITGWSAKDDIIGKSVFNENDEKIGDVNDIVISSDGRSMYLLIGAGGFLGMGAKDVAVPFDRFKRTDDRILLSGYTKEQLKALPEVRTKR